MATELGNSILSFPRMSFLERNSCQVTASYSKREKTSFQPLDTSVLTDGDILDFVLEYNYRKEKRRTIQCIVFC